MGGTSLTNTTAHGINPRAVAVADQVLSLSAASSCRIRIWSCAASRIKDSNSAGVNGFTTRNDAGLGLFERVESVAGNGSEVGFDVAEFFTKLSDFSIGNLIFALY
jgi:hypothetical protein